jgi:hypothetical protein
MTPRQAREQLLQMRNRAEQAAQGKRFKSHAEALDDFFKQTTGPSPEMQRTGTRLQLADYY